MKGFSNELEAGRALQCRMDGCRNRWVVDINFGKVCSHHDGTLARGGSSVQPSDRPQRHQAPIPLRDAVRPYAEPLEPDEEYVHDAGA